MNEPFTGRVFVIATKTPAKGQPPGLGWFNPHPCFRRQDVAKMAARDAVAQV